MPKVSLDVGATIDAGSEISQPGLLSYVHSYSDMLGWICSYRTRVLYFAGKFPFRWSPTGTCASSNGHVTECRLGLPQTLAARVSATSAVAGTLGYSFYYSRTPL